MGWCSHWSLDEAVRELLQNQFDAIIENCGKYTLGPSNPWTACKPCKTNKELGGVRGFLTKVYGAEGGEPEGYMLWVPGRKLLVLVNRKATLPPNSLLVGSSGKLEIQVSWKSDVVTIVSGLEKLVVLDNYFLLRSHQAVCHRSQLARPRQYLRLLAGDRSALLWPAAPATGSSLASESVAKRVFVAGIFWEQKSSQKHYGVDFSAMVSNNRDRTNIHHPTYQQHMAQIVDRLLKKGSEDVMELLLPVLLLELGQAEEDSHHLHRLPEFITPPAYARLLAAFKRKLVPPQRFLCPRTEEERKALEHCATKDYSLPGR